MLLSDFTRRQRRCARRHKNDGGGNTYARVAHTAAVGRQEFFFFLESTMYARITQRREFADHAFMKLRSHAQYTCICTYQLNIFIKKNARLRITYYNIIIFYIINVTLRDLSTNVLFSDESDFTVRSFYFSSHILLKVSFDYCP